MEPADKGSSLSWRLGDKPHGITIASRRSQYTYQQPLNNEHRTADGAAGEASKVMIIASRTQARMLDTGI
jgi:hypothetical protein